MKNLIFVLIVVVSINAIAATCDELAEQAVPVGNNISDYVRAKQAKQAMLVSGCGGRSRQIEQPPQPVNTPPQYVHNIGKWCQVVNGNTQCW